MEGEFAIWWHDENRSTHVHAETYPTAEEAAQAARRLGIVNPIIHPL